MADKKYKVIVSDKAKRMLGTHIRFMAEVSKEAAIAKKKRTYDGNAFFRAYTAAFSFL